MYFRLTQVDIQDGKMEDTLAYASSVMDSLKEWIKDRLPERTTWDGAVCIGLGLLVLFITPLAKIAAGAVILYGAWTIWKGE